MLIFVQYRKNMCPSNIVMWSRYFFILRQIISSRTVEAHTALIASDEYNAVSMLHGL